MIIPCKGETFLLCKERVMYWEAKKTLIISDLHIGKAAFFRKSGIQVPATVGQTDLDRLSECLASFETEVLLVTGDMFHNYMNSDVAAFKQWREQYPTLQIKLIKGNHDGLKPEEYETLGIEVHLKELLYGPFRFVHEEPDTFDEYYNISGHIHPGITLFGRARQQLRLPCFFFGKTCAILPAFSVFTGLSMLKPKDEDEVYAITPTGVVAV
jgi:DNA ligase-associated metallophosphoesterase